MSDDDDDDDDDDDRVFLTKEEGEEEEDITFSYKSLAIYPENQAEVILRERSILVRGLSR